MAAQDIGYVELYVGDYRSAVDYFVTSFGFTRAAESVGHGSRSTLLRQGTMQLIVTAGQETEEFLDAHGDGIADIAFTCDDAVQTRAEAVAAGASAIGSVVLARNGGPGVQHLAFGVDSITSAVREFRDRGI